MEYVDYEKLHKDTIAKLQEMVNSGKITVETACCICADFVPESEDERIREDIIRCLKHSGIKPDRPINPHVRTTMKDALAWLEKQSKASNVEQAMREVEEKADAFTKAHKGETSDEILAQMRGEQKPWTEEDDQYLLVCKNALAKYQVSDKWDATIISRWLEDKVKSSVQQPKQEWSENDKQYLEDTLTLLEGNRSVHTYGEVKNWLKFLKPQSQWKPSDEQMKALLNMRFAVERFGPSASLAALDDLYEQLKKL